MFAIMIACNRNHAVGLEQTVQRILEDCQVEQRIE